MVKIAKIKNIAHEEDEAAEGAADTNRISLSISE